MTRIRIATFNIRNGRAFDGWNSWPLRRKATAAAVASLEAEVIGLQEVYRCQRRWLLRQLDVYDAFGGGRGDGDRRGEACPVLLDRRRGRVVRHVVRWFGDWPDVPGSMLPEAHHPRIATICTIELDGAPTFDVVCTHLDTNRTRRAANLRQLITWLDPTRPQIVVGDLNGQVGDRVLDPLWEAGLRSAIPVDAAGSSHDFTGRTDGPRIDHVLVNSHVDVLGGEVQHPRPGGRLPSDHWPVVADLRLKTSPTDAEAPE